MDYPRQLTLFLLLATVGAAPHAEPTYRFAKLYEGAHRPRGAVAFIQVLKTEHGGQDARRDLPATLESVDGSAVLNDAVAHELHPGLHTFKGYCQGIDGQKIRAEFPVWMKRDYIYELLARRSWRSCWIMIRGLGRLHSTIDAKVPPGEPSLSSPTYTSMFDSAADRHPEVWADLTSAVYKFITERYQCPTYVLRKVVWKDPTGRVWLEPGQQEISIKGPYRELWKIEACGTEHSLEMRLTKPGNYGKYVSIRDVTGSASAIF
jgi:hypothetical protein